MSCTVSSMVVNTIKEKKNQDKGAQEFVRRTELLNRVIWEWCIFILTDPAFPRVSDVSYIGDKLILPRFLITPFLVQKSLIPHCPRDTVSSPFPGMQGPHHLAQYSIAFSLLPPTRLPTVLQPHSTLYPL